MDDTEAQVEVKQAEPMSHSGALDAITDCAATTTTLSYQEAIEGYLKLRGVSHDDLAHRSSHTASPELVEAASVLLGRFNQMLAQKENADTCTSYSGKLQDIGVLFCDNRDTVRTALQTTPSQPMIEANLILQAVLAEVEKATRKFPTWPTRIIDAGNVVAEEAGELSKACLQVTYEKEKETLDGVRMEAIQTAAMCLRFLASMDRYDTEPAEQHEQPPFDTLLSQQEQGA